jgi:hypothetical protein
MKEVTIGWRMGKRRNIHKILVGKPEAKRSRRRHRRRWEDNIKMDLDVDWMYMAQNRDQWWTSVKMVMNLRVPKQAEIFLTS